MDKLVSNLSMRLLVSKRQARILLTEVFAEIIESSEEESVHIKNFGTFEKRRTSKKYRDPRTKELKESEDKCRLIFTASKNLFSRDTYVRD